MENGEICPSVGFIFLSTYKYRNTKRNIEEQLTLIIVFILHWSRTARIKSDEDYPSVSHSPDYEIDKSSLFIR